MTAPERTPSSFSYRAQTDKGQAISGTIDASDLIEARVRLTALGLRVIELAEVKQPAKARPLGRDDFAAFNQQLANLAAAGLPIERGLRLIAQDLERGRLRDAVHAVADELERGTPLDRAFEMHRARFPILYSQLMHAGIRTGNLPGVLLNYGRHLEIMHRLRSMVWQSALYPIVVMIGVAAVLIFISNFIVPQFRSIFDDFGTSLPALTELLLAVAEWMPVIILTVLAILIGLPTFWRLAASSGESQGPAERLLFALPLIGPVIKRNVVARWCDALKLSVDAGIDLPTAIDLTGQVVGSPGAMRDGKQMVQSLASGAALDDKPASAVLPVTVQAAIRFGCEQNDLPRTLAVLSDMYQQQAEMRLGIAQVTLLPILLIILAGFIGFVVTGLFLPLVRLIQSVC